jgi:hypothetical protein
LHAQQAKPARQDRPALQRASLKWFHASTGDFPATKIQYVLNGLKHPMHLIIPSLTLHVIFLHKKHNTFVHIKHHHLAGDYAKI